MESHTFMGWPDATQPLVCYSNRNLLKHSGSLRQGFSYSPQTRAHVLSCMQHFSPGRQKIKGTLDRDVHSVHHGFLLCVCVLEFY